MGKKEHGAADALREELGGDALGGRNDSRGVRKKPCARAIPS